ncbi:hypothetical protein HDU93_009592 [Gonapodya sp. JEL0774]|nr:hypothetical protein HDU93_009592 [Gonapodya sp. JEL0774]
MRHSAPTRSPAVNWQVRFKPEKMLEASSSVPASNPALPPTDTLYHTDTTLFSFDGASLIAIVGNSDSSETQPSVHTPIWKSGEFALAFNKTIFHPFGGGQDSDSGTVELSHPDHDVVYHVREARMDRTTGVIWHYGSFAPRVTDSQQLLVSAPAPADWHEHAQLRLAINPTRRIRNARLHSAGHLIDLAVMDVGLMSAPGSESSMGGFAAGKGSHLEGQCWVEYEGKVPDGWSAGASGAAGGPDASLQTPKKPKASKNAPSELPVLLPPLLNSALNRIVRQHLTSPVLALNNTPYAEAAKLCGGSLPPYIAPDSTPRVVVMVPGTVGCPCGGTHVKGVGEFLQRESGCAVVVTSVIHKKGRLRIVYTVDA